jgi:hypothetical protein
MNWPEAFTTLFGCVGVALIFHGFPSINIKIGGKHTYINGVEQIEEEEDDY